jgi:predicted GIY-YIG superfamily endonuclease
MEKSMYVYLINSIPNPTKRYVGLTADLKPRLEEHNGGMPPSTAEHRPWRLVAYLKFDDPQKAEKFEAYLKHGSGYTFAKRHLW